MSAQLLQGFPARVVKSDAGNEGRIVTLYKFNPTLGVWTVRALQLRAIREGDGKLTFRNYGNFRPDQLEAV